MVLVVVKVGGGGGGGGGGGKEGWKVRMVRMVRKEVW